LDFSTGDTGDELSYQNLHIQDVTFQQDPTTADFFSPYVHRERKRKQNSGSETDLLRSQDLNPGPPTSPSVWKGDTKDTYPNSNFVIFIYGLNHVLRTGNWIRDERFVSGRG
jgi:hypothetical protein